MVKLVSFARRIPVPKLTFLNNEVRTFLLALSIVLLPAQVSGFDLAKGNAARDVVQRVAVEAVLTDFSPNASDASVVLRVFTMISNAQYDAISPYHPTAVGVYTRLGRRPATESQDNTKMNIAMLHASHKVLSHIFPNRISEWDQLLRKLGLDPSDTSEDLNTEVGIGNAAGRGVVEGRSHDGMNQLGDETGRLTYLQPFEDYTGYQPVNTAYDLVDPSRWQPSIQLVNAANYRIQHFVTPQYRFVEPYSFPDPRSFGVPAPTNSDFNNLEAYTAQAQQVVDISAELDEYKKITAEFFDNKIFSLGGSGFKSSTNANLDLFDFVVARFFANIATFDAGIVVWQEKTKYDAVRPFSAIRHLFHGQLISARSAGLSEDNRSLRGEEWAAYLPEADHPEYPSASACFCAAHAEFKRLYFASDDLNWSISFPAGGSGVEPGRTPAENLSINLRTWTEFEQTCASSRVWAGVHFQSAVDESLKLCPIFGKMAYDYMQELVSGTAKERNPSRSTMK